MDMMQTRATRLWLDDMAKVAKMQGGLPYDHLNAMGTIRNRAWFDYRSFTNALGAWRAALPGSYKCVTDWVDRTQPSGNVVAEFLTDLIERMPK